MNFFYKESKSKKKIFFCGLGGGGGAGVSEIFFTLNLSLK